MEAISNQARKLYAEADDQGRQKIQEDLRELQTSFDTEWDMVVRLAKGFLEMALVKVGTDLQIFQLLAESDRSLNLDHIAEKSGAARGLLAHLLRASAAFGQIKETGKDEFTANRLTKVLADPNVSAAVVHCFDVHGAVALVLPDFLKERNYQNITSIKDLPFQKAIGTDLTPFEWMQQHPEQLESLGRAMAIQRGSHWVHSYPVLREVGAHTPSSASALLVDIGGGFGQQAKIFRDAFPTLRGRIVVQDIAGTLDRAPPTEGIEFQVHDFFQTQPIKHAKFYYLRHILHDWTDDECASILKAIVPAMGPESRVVIDEVVLPDTGTPWQAAYMDLTMLTSLGGAERTKADYETLLGRAGLKVVDIHKYDAKMQSVILAAPE